MKIVVLVAGKSSRLRPLTDNKHKALLEIGDKTLIEHQLEAFKEAGVDEVIFVVGHKADLIKEKIGENYKGIKIKYIYNPDYSTKNIDYSLYCARDEFKDENFIYLEGDLFFHSNIIKKLIKSKYDNCLCVDKDYKSSKVDTVILGKKNRAEGLVFEENGDVREKVENENIAGELLLMVKFNKDASNFLIQELEKCNFVGETKIYNIFGELIKLKEVSYIEIKNLPWVEIDNIEDLNKAREEVYSKIKD